MKASKKSLDFQSFKIILPLKQFFFFRGGNNMGRLQVDDVKNKDRGAYKCRVDFYKAPTLISKVVLDVIGKSD